MAGNFSVLFLALLQVPAAAQFSGQLQPGHLGGETASVAFTSPDPNATASGIPDWFQGVQRSSNPISGGLHQITVRWTYGDNWSPGQNTAVRSAIITAGPHTETIEQSGIDNTYVYSITPHQIDTDHLPKSIELRIYGNVGSSPFALASDAAWVGLRSALMLNTLLYNVPPDDPQHGIRASYSTIQVVIESNHAADAITSPRETTFRVGPPGDLDTTFTVRQAGVDNAYQVTLPPPLSGGGGEALVTIDAAVPGSIYTHASGSPWITVFPSRTYQTITYPRSNVPPGFFDHFTVRAEAQGNDKSAYYESRSGSILIQNKPYAIEQLGAGARFESVSAEANSQVAISYRLGHQSPESSVSLAYSLDGVQFHPIPEESCLNSSGHLGEGVAPGDHHLIWNAAQVAAALLDEEDEISLRLVASGGWSALSDPFTLEPECACEDCPPGKVQAKVDRSISIEIPLGSDALGRSFGRFWIHEETASATLGTPAVLWRTALNGARTFPANAKAPTQFLTPAILAEISDPDPNDKTWTLKFFDRASQLGPFNPVSGTYNQSGATPLQLVTFTLTQGANRFIQSFDVTETGVYGDRTHSFPWQTDNVIACSWKLNQSGPGGDLPPSSSRRESATEQVSADGRIRTKDRRITDGDNRLASRSVSTTKRFSFGNRRTQIEQYIIQPDGSSTGSRSRFYAYQEEENAPGYGRIAETYTDYDASWTAHRYDANGRSVILRPYRSAGRGSPDSALDVTRISKTTANLGLGPLEDRARIVSRSLANQVVSRTVTISFADLLSDTLSDGTGPFACREKWTVQVLDPAIATAADALASPLSLITKHRTYADGEYAGLTRSILFPDGTITIFEYRTGETVQWSGVPSADGRSILQGIRETETSNAHGQIVAYQAVAIPGNLVIAEQVALEQDELGRATRIRHLDSSISLRQYSCCGLISETGRDGITTSYIRDHLGRIRSSTSLGVTTAYELSALGTVRSVTQNAAGLSIQRSTAESDSLGIEQRSTAPGNRTTRAVQTHSADGQRIATITRPDGGTIVQRHFHDGRLQSISGTATVPRRFEYGVENHQSFRKEIRLGSNGEDAEWIQTFTDMAGRVSKVVRSHESGTPAVATNHYNNKGQLIRTVDPDGVILLFAYNELGEQTAVAVDLNGNNVIDLNGPDRIVTTERSWSLREGKATRKMLTKAYPTSNMPAAANLVATETAVDGLETWQTAAGLSSHERTILEGNGNRTLTRTAPDGTQEVTQIRNGRVASVARLSADGAQISRQESTYDSLGRLISSSDARTGATTFVWDDNDQLVNLTEPGSRVTSFTYDAAGRPDLTTLPDGEILNQDWTPLGLLHRQSGARSYPIEFGYDSQGRRTSLTTAAGITRWSYYPESGRLAQKLHPDLRGLTFTYTAGGRLSRRTSARGIVTAYSYDNAGEV
ncbi:MAG: RHS Repeat/RHS Repeat, partial [Verrucomicrobia bacterium]